MSTLAISEDWRPGWVFDGRKNLYGPSMFLPQHESCYTVSNALLANSKCAFLPL